MVGRRAFMGLCACWVCAPARLAAAPARGKANPPAIGEDNAASAPPSLPPVHHVGLVVRDRERTLANLAGALGVRSAYRFEGAFPAAKLASGLTGFSLRGAFVWMRNTALEIVEPVDDRSPQAAFLQARGEGLHHLAFWVGSIQAQIDAMARGGAPPRMVADGTGPGNPARWCYLEGDMAGGALLELIERNPASEQFYADVFRTIGGQPPR